MPYIMDEFHDPLLSYKYGVVVAMVPVASGGLADFHFPILHLKMLPLCWRDAN